MDLGLRGRYALVTGGTHGIGLAIATMLADEGCNVAVCSRDAKRVAEAQSSLQRSGVESLGIQGDALKPTDIDKVMREVIDSWRTIHILVNNVGGGGRWGGPSIEETPEDVWTDVYNKNATAAVRFTKLALPFMKKQKWGRVVTIASIHGKEAGGRPWFAMAKSAEISLMKTLSKDKSLVRSGITFNSVAPGSIMIPGTGWDEERKKDPTEFGRMVESQFPLGRLGTPQEVASLVVFLCSDKAALINGACVTVDGGESSSF